MNISELFDRPKKVFSLEIFPPKRTDGIDSLYEVLDRMAAIKPDYISVTYSAGGTANNTLTCRIAADIKHRFGIEPLAHLTSLHNTREQVDAQLDELKANGVENILALRGDRRPELVECDDFPHASDLAAFIRDKGGFNCVGACYPAGHPESAGRAQDVCNLRYKLEAGITHLNSQLFFDNEEFFGFMELCCAAGIDVPIEAGIMPIMSAKQITRMMAFSAAGIPRQVSRILARYENDPDGLFKAGLQYSIGQIAGLLANGVDGIHLYTMNRPEVAEQIYESVKNLL